jgi:hypothetical protein
LLAAQASILVKKNNSHFVFILIFNINKNQNYDFCLCLWLEAWRLEVGGWWAKANPPTTNHQPSIHQPAKRSKNYYFFLRTKAKTKAQEDIDLI